MNSDLLFLIFFFSLRDKKKKFLGHNFSFSPRTNDRSVMSVQSDILDIINDESTRLLPRDVVKPPSTISWIMAAGLIINAAMGVRPSLSKSLDDRRV